ncbi:ATP-binding protein, partial [Streptomyces sp. NPDC095613]|uniref:ATP-binding protein n=1 Tax=Streptomyces sp. NPDC095613 TaxID=3155540 RepID=UPI00332A6842
HGAEVFGDLLRLDHNTSQLGLLTDRLALLMGGRASRSWNKPIGMESILRGAVGRIAAYQRVRLHCSSRAAIAGFAAEPVMHLLAELMDNAANFSPPIDEVHVYVEERAAGIVVTIEDSGLKMAAAAMRRAEEAVSGRVTDLALLQGTRLGLAVVGRLAAKYHISVNYRPSSRGGTGVVVLFPPQLLAQDQGPTSEQPTQSLRRPAARTAARTPDAPTGTAAPAGSPPALPDPPAPAAPLPPSASPASPATPATPSPLDLPMESPGQAAAPVAPYASGPSSTPAKPRTPTDGPTDSLAAPADGPGLSTPNGLPVRPPGRTMAAADRGRPRPGSQAETARPSRDAGAQFGAFHRARRSPDGPSGTPAE